MPSFIEKDGHYFVAYITGPSHVLLGLRLTDQEIEPKLIKQPPQGTCFHGELDEVQIREAVNEVLAAFRAEGANIYAAEIVYVENDSPRYDLFRAAAYSLIKHYLNCGEFKREA